MKPNVMVQNLLENGKLFYKCPSNLDIDIYKKLTADQPVDDDLARSLSGVGSSLDDALRYAGEFGTIATMPLLVAALATADEEHPLWLRYPEYHPRRSFGSFTSRTERILYEDMGKIWGIKNSSVVLYVHGGTIISSDRINSEISRRHAGDKSLKLNPTTELFSHAELLWIRPQEVYDLLEEIENGRLPLYEVEDVKKNKIADPFSRYAVAVPLVIAQRAKTSVGKRAFLENPLVLAAAGTPEYLEPPFARLTKPKAFKVIN